MVDLRKVSSLATMKVPRDFSFPAFLLMNLTIVNDIKQECKAKTCNEMHRRAFGFDPIDGEVVMVGISISCLWS